jgi:rod shape-determining protein MreD
MMALSDRTPGVRPRATFGRGLDIALRQAFPAITSIVLMFLSMVHFGLSGQSELLPTVSTTCVWFWSLYRPSAMPPPVVFLIGLLLDILGFLPLGVGPVTMLATHGLAHRLRNFLSRQGFFVVWLTFTMTACAMAAMNWSLVSLLSFRLEPRAPVLFEAGLAFAMYPLVAIPMAMARRKIADPDLT